MNRNVDRGQFEFTTEMQYVKKCVCFLKVAQTSGLILSTGKLTWLCLLQNSEAVSVIRPHVHPTIFQTRPPWTR